jgi:hypothetical protein
VQQQQRQQQQQQQQEDALLVALMRSLRCRKGSGKGCEVGLFEVLTAAASSKQQQAGFMSRLPLQQAWPCWQHDVSLASWSLGVGGK